MQTTLCSPRNQCVGATEILPTNQNTNRHSTEAYTNNEQDQNQLPLSRHQRMKTSFQRVTKLQTAEYSIPQAEYRPLDEINGSLSQPLTYIEDQIARYKRKVPKEIFMKLQNDSQKKFQTQLEKVRSLNKAQNLASQQYMGNSKLKEMSSKNSDKSRPRNGSNENFSSRINSASEDNLMPLSVAQQQIAHRRVMRKDARTVRKMQQMR